MNSKEKFLRIWLLITLLFIVMVGVLKYISYSIGNGLPYSYFLICGFSAMYQINRHKNQIIKMIEKDYPEFSEKLSSKVLDYNLGISSFKFAAFIQFGSKTGIEIIDKQTEAFKYTVSQMNFIILISFFITVIKFYLI